MNNKLIYTLLVIIVLFFGVQAYGKEAKHVRFTAQPSKTSVKAGEKFGILLTMKIDKWWHTYSLNEQLSKEGIGPTQTEIKVEPKDLIVLSGKIKAPKPKVEYDKGFEMIIEYYKAQSEFEIIAKAKKALSFPNNKVYVSVYLELCDTSKCLPPEEYKVQISNKTFTPSTGLLEGSLETDTNSAGSTDEEKISSVNNNIDSSQTIPAGTAGGQIKKTKSGGNITESQKEINKKENQGIFSFIWFAMGAGALALLTPCVFPMVPITVSFFTKRAEKKKGRGLRDSIVYALGIISTFTAFGLIISLIFGATAIQDFATSPWVNMAIAALFIAFAFNLFGAFEIQLPVGLLNKLNMKSQGSGIGSVLLMGLTFSLTSFTCTMPFVGSALVATSGGHWFYPAIGMLAYSAVFAAPFFLLALFPTAMQSMPKAGGWMNNVKVVMGFLEIAAAMKFVSNFDLVWGLGIMPREIFLAIWLGCGILITLYILGVFRFEHDSPVEGVKSLRMVFALFFAAFSFYLMSGLFGNPLGELDAFLPPPDYKEIINASSFAPSLSAVTPDTALAKRKSPSVQNEQDSWLHDYKTGLALAKQEKKPLFIDFTGFTCTNCRWMELNMFSKPEVQNLIDKMVKVRLYTDRRGEPYASNKHFQETRFNSIELPLYVIITPDEKLIGTKAFTRDQNDFVSFLKKAFD